MIIAAGGALHYEDNVKLSGPAPRDGPLTTTHRQSMRSGTLNAHEGAAVARRA